MKNKLLLYYLLAIVSASFFFTACSDDDNDMPDTHTATSGEYWEGVAGVYRGKMDVNIDGIVVDTIYQQVEIASDNRNRMILSITSLTVDDMKWNNIFFKDVYFSKNGNEVSFTAKTVQHMGTIANVSLTLNGTISVGYMNITILANSLTILPTTLSMKAEKWNKTFNNESSIINFTLDHELVIKQPTHLVGNRWVFYVSDTLDMDSTEILVNPRNMKFDLSDGATISYPDSTMDFSKDVTYTVWAEDYIHRTEYKIFWIKALIKKYDIGRWWPTEGGWSEPFGGWATNNGSLKALKDLGVYDGEYLVKRVKGMEIGDWATEMRSVMTGEGENRSIFAGSLFQGNFDLSMKEPLKGLVYGVPSERRYYPVSVSGYYKYIPSEEVYVGNSLYISDTIAVRDSCMIRAILYEVDSQDDCLDSINYMNDEKIIAVAEMGYQAGRYQTEFTEFNIYFESIRSFFVTKNYKIAVICSSSRDADKKRGAPRSVLTVGGIEVMYSNLDN